ncbi:MAG: MBL fold metallo-hydrolase [Candidatus Bathyarchaeota archaeon]|nr:MBL fold metallo-hydrolase [Candidatus Bathyarchaeota archaeon]
MQLKRFKVGWLSTNCYVLSCEQTKQAAVIDPGIEIEDEAEQILGYIKQNGLQVKYIINTHGHPDHRSGNTVIKKTTNAQVLIHENNFEHVPADKTVKDGDVITIGNIKLAVLYTPGHTPDGISLLGESYVFTGDTLFAGSIGRTDFAGGSFHDIINSIKTKLMVLPDNFTVYPGHESASTIGNEKKYNPFLQS